MNSTITTQPISTNPQAYVHRTTYVLVRSCLTTLFLCTYTSLHPNLPEKLGRRSLIQKLARKTAMLYVAVLFPEFMTTWAVNQWYCARRITKEVERVRPNWTSTHSFLLLMGGFVDRHTGKRISEQVMVERLKLSRDELKLMEWEICDRSKTNGVAKGIAVIQATWFLIQFFARIPNHLAITELELVTAAYAFLTLGTYMFWWSKPLDIECPIYLDGLKQSDGDEPLLDTLAKGTPWYWYLYAPLEYLIQAPLEALCVLIYTETKELDRLEGEKELRYFQGGTSILATTLSCILAAVFGFSHFAAWWLSFPTARAKNMWMGCSIAITAGPLCMLVFHMIPAIEDADNNQNWIRWVVLRALAVILWLIVYCYTFARLMLIVQMFVLLRHQPESAFITINWSRYIPHL